MSSGQPPLDTKLHALGHALADRDPFYSGTCSIPPLHRFLYFPEGDHFRRIDFSNTGADDFDALYHACQPAEFGLNGESVLDEAYRKAGKIDVDSFVTHFDPCNLGITEQVSKALLYSQSYKAMDIELYKLNVYGVGGFFKPHKDTPRSQNMFGSLVVVLPAPHEGGQLFLRKDHKEWTVDCAEKLAATTEPSVCFVAFYSDVEHQVLPVTSGHRVTLTYHLFRKPTGVHPTSSILTPYHQNLKKTLADLVNDTSVLPNGGYLGFGLAHEYIHTGRQVMDLLSDQLKGSDRALADVCDALGLRFTLRLLFRDMWDCDLGDVNLLTTKEIEIPPSNVLLGMGNPWSLKPFHDALEGWTIEDAEGVEFVGRPERTIYRNRPNWLKPFYKNPVSEVLEVMPMEVSSVSVRASCLAYTGNEPNTIFYYGKACMVVAVEPAESRKLVGL